MWETMLRLARDSKGATAVEYGLVVALIVIASMGALALFGDRAIAMWTEVATAVLNS